MTTDKIIASLNQKLNPGRFEHTMGVARTAKWLALKYGADSNKAYLAGILHDCAKCLSHEELLQRIEKYHITLDAISLKSPQLLHSFVGAHEAREVYGIDDEEIFDAVYYHTIGKENMSTLTRIVYLADAIEPMRNYPGVNKIRKTAEESLDEAVFMYTDSSIRFILDRGALLHPNTLALRNSFIAGV